MTLSSHVPHPSTRTFVLKLHREALAGAVGLSARLESLLSGEQFVFFNAGEPVACITRALAPADANGETARCRAEARGAGLPR